MPSATIKEPVQSEEASPTLPASQAVISPCPLLDTKEVAAFLNVKESTIRHWVHIGYMPHIKFRGAVRYQRDAITQWVETCAVSKAIPDGRTLSKNILRSHNRRY